jgi:hypothetical protein
MTTEKQNSQETATSLAERAVACKGWRWMPGMLDADEPVCRIVRVTSDDQHDGQFLDYGWPDEEGDDPDGIVVSSEYGPHGNFLPDLDDPATLGCLLVLVREAWGEPYAHPVRTVRGMATAESRGYRPPDAVDIEGGGWATFLWSVNRGRGNFHDALGGYHGTELEHEHRDHAPRRPARRVARSPSRAGLPGVQGHHVRRPQPTQRHQLVLATTRH